MPSISQDTDTELLDSTSSICTPTQNPAVTKNTLAQQQLQDQSHHQHQFSPTQQRSHHAYGTIFHSVGGGSGGHSRVSFMPNTTTTAAAFEHYRMQLYNYALNIERLRCPGYSAAAAMAAAAAYGNNSGGSGGSSNNGYEHVAAAAVAGYIPGSGGDGGNGSRMALSMSLFPQRIFQPEEPKPQHSYIGLIAMAILNSAETKLVLSDIYQYILDNYPYFRTRGPGWRNSIRHNLSLNDCFIKSGRSANGKGHYWAIHPANMEDFRKGDFRRRKAQRKVRKHMGLTVDDVGTDSPSPPPLDLTASPPLAIAHSHQLATAQQLAAFGYLQQQHYHHHHHHHSHPQPIMHQPQQLYQQSSSSDNHLPQFAAAQLAHVVPRSAQIQSNDNNKSSSSNQQQSHLHPYPNTNQLAIINETTTTTASVIANLYSQSRKRQFDVASLLAPDVVTKVVDIVEDVVGDCEPSTATAGITTTQHTVITKVSVQHQHHLHHHQPHIPAAYHQHHQMQQQLQQLQPPLAANIIQKHLIELEIDEQEDIDVVASDDVLTDEKVADGQQQSRLEPQIADTDEDEQYTDACYASNNSLHSSLDAETTTNTEEAAINCDDSRHQSPLSEDAALTTLLLDVDYQKDSTPPPANSVFSANESTTSVLSSPAAASAAVEQHRHSVHRLMLQHLQHQQQQPPQTVQINSTGSSNVSDMDPHIFGRYYGTYMAAAAARRIGGMQLTLQNHETSTQQQQQQQQQ